MPSANGVCAAAVELTEESYFIPPDDSLQDQGSRNAEAGHPGLGNQRIDADRTRRGVDRSAVKHGRRSCDVLEDVTPSGKALVS